MCQAFSLSKKEYTVGQLLLEAHCLLVRSNVLTMLSGILGGSVVKSCTIAWRKMSEIVLAPLKCCSSAADNTVWRNLLREEAAFLLGSNCVFSDSHFMTAQGKVSILVSLWNFSKVHFGSLSSVTNWKVDYMGFYSLLLLFPYMIHGHMIECCCIIVHIRIKGAHISRWQSLPRVLYIWVGAKMLDMPVQKNQYLNLMMLWVQPVTAPQLHMNI